MKEITISDISLRLAEQGGVSLTFREKLEVAKWLDRLQVSAIELPAITSVKADSLLIKSIAASVKNSAVAVPAGLSAESARIAFEAVKGARHPRLLVIAPLSAARMEYVSHKKADSMRKAVTDTLSACQELTEDVEFIADDATRSDFAFLCSVLADAVSLGVKRITISDAAGAMLTSEFGRFIASLKEAVPALENVVLGASCSNALHLADACCTAALVEGCTEIKASALPLSCVSLENMSSILSTKGDALQCHTGLMTTEMKRVLDSIHTLTTAGKNLNSPFENSVREVSSDLVYTADDSMEEVMKGVEKLGYDLQESDKMRVWNAFCRIIARKKNVGVSELEAIIASESMQVPATYTLDSFMVTTGSAIDILAHVKLKKQLEGKPAEVMDGLSLGEGPIAAAFFAIEQIVGRHYEVDDFQIQSVTEGREAMGQTIVKLRAGGKIYSGRGLSTDIVGSGIEAYLNALNKIVYDENTI